ncbi:MAG TPA: PIN domain-containing protein [Pyrinomonadaceae bacterium]|jgi:predicted nucleic acid-binding protein|nr:PIN domain-containing protein [Pyrinomonadaceae bacterium]
MRVLLDTNVVLDFVLERAPYFEAAAELFELIAAGTVRGFVSGITPINVYYVGRKFVGREKARNRVRDLLIVLETCPITSAALNNALALPFKDYEDAVQHASAIETGLDAIITRDLGDYQNSVLPVFAPVEFLQHQKSKLKEESGT